MYIELTSDRFGTWDCKKMIIAYLLTWFLLVKVSVEIRGEGMFSLYIYILTYLLIIII